jgi:deazaflavin-dependent oxidoreductase (nitroreductase family)
VVRDPNRSLMPAWLPAFNRKVNNPIQRLWAPYAPGYALIVHTGRKSGKRYETPVMAMVADGKLAIGLPYGAGAQWVRNLLAAGGGEAIRRGKRYRLSNPRVVTDAAAEPLPPIAARLSRRMAVLVTDFTAS